MARYVFKPIEIGNLGRPVVIEVPKKELKELKEQEEGVPEQPEGPSLEEIQKQIDEERQVFEKELAEKKAEIESEAQQIRREAENWAFNKIKEADEEYKKRIADAENRSKNIVSDAQKNADMVMQETQDKVDEIKDQAFQSGFDNGREEGFNTGKGEVDRLISRLNIILASAIRKRNEIIEEAETQVIDIVIQVARKIVKTITENQKRIVVENIKEALGKLKGRAEITIRVNSEDLQLTTKHKKDFIGMIEGIEQVKILEDNTVERGGCIISTDFGAIDAKISSQLSEIEQKIRELAPYKEEI